MIAVLTTIILATCGVLYALFYEKLPGKRPFWKAFIFGLALYIISRVGDTIIDFPISRGLVLENALFSAPFLLFLYPYLPSKLYIRESYEGKDTSNIIQP